MPPSTRRRWRRSANGSRRASRRRSIRAWRSWRRATITKAEASFKKAIEPDVDSTAPLAFLAASFAAAGKDHEAASAWQTALVDGTELPQIYVWLSDALLRTHDFGGARAILEEASGKWPTDTRFTKPLAMLYGTFGRGREAVRTLERYLDDRQDDRDAYFSRCSGSTPSTPAARWCTAAPKIASAPTTTRTPTCEHEGRRRPSSSSGWTTSTPKSNVSGCRASSSTATSAFLPRVDEFLAPPAFSAAAFFGAAADGRGARARGLRGLARPSSSAVVSIGLASGSSCSSSPSRDCRLRRDDRGCGSIGWFS